MLAFIWSPAQFFAASLAQPPRWPLALAAPALCTLLDGAAVHLVTGRILASLNHAQGAGAVPEAALQAARWSSLTTVITYPATFALSILILASVDTLAAESGRQRRYIDLAGLAFAAFVPGCVFALAAAMMWTPAAAFTTDPESLSRFALAVRADPWLSTAGILYHFGLAWYVVLLGIILTAARALSARASALVALGLFVSLGGFRLLQFLPPLTRW